jgi:hypothetical protein
MVERGDIRGSAKIPKSTTNKILSIILILLIIGIILLTGYIVFEMKDTSNTNAMKTCGDSSFYNTCSITKPYFCDQGILIENSNLCGCPEDFEKKENMCISKYSKEPMEFSFEYTLNGELGIINFIMYKGVYDYLYAIPRSISYEEGEISSRADFKLNSINEEVQKDFLIPLVIEIQNKAETKEDQARIAISLVQNIPFGDSDTSIKFGGNSINYFRYPYQVLYDDEGVCGEKVELLGFLLRELGYGISFFYFSEENHEALGIKCPIKESIANSGYCFIETTGPSILSESEINYVGYGRIESIPQIFLLSDGFALPENMDEYKDAERMDKIKKSLEKRDGRLDFYKYLMNQKLKKKYGLTNGKAQI